MFRNGITKVTRSSFIGMMDNGIPLPSSDYEMTYKEKKNCHATIKIQMKIHFYLLKQRTIPYLRIGQKICLCTMAIKGHAQKFSGQIISPATWEWNGARLSYWLLHFSEIGYCGHPTHPYANIKLKQTNKFILSKFQEEDHPLIHDTQNKGIIGFLIYILHT